MPEFTEAEQGSTSRQGSGHRSSMTINKELQSNKTRIGSAKYYDVASALLGKGKADLEQLFLNAARDGDFDQIENFLLRRSDVIVSIDVKDKRTGNTALIWAAKRGHTKIVQLLLKYCADITLRNYENQTAVEVASPAIKTILLDSVERISESSHRLLLQAAWQGNIKVLRKLLNDNKVKDINCQNADGLTALLLVCRDAQLFERLSTQLNRPYNPVEVVEELLKHRANIHAQDSDDKICLHYAVQSKASHSPKVVQTILNAGPNLDARDKRLFAPIHCASQTGNVECLEVLLGGGSNVNNRGYNGATPLHVTAYNDHEKAASCLLKHGADITLVDDTGLTALDLARSRKMKTTLKEAWTEATQNRQSTNLAPLKTPGREDTRLSVEDNRKKKGEVIFDALPTNPFSNMKSTPSKGKPVSRHLSLKEKANKAEENMMKDIENGDFRPSPYINTKTSDTERKSRKCSPCRDGVRRLGMMRGQRASPTPLPKVGSKERLPAISPSPDRMGNDRNTDSPAFNRNTRFRRSLEEGKLVHKNGKPATYPAPGGRASRVSPLTIREVSRTSPLTIRDNNRVSPLTVRDSNRVSPLTVLEDADVDQCMHINRFQQLSPTPMAGRFQKTHRRAGSDTNAATASDILTTCGNIITKGRSISLSHSEEFGDHMTHHVTRHSIKEVNQYTPMSREATQNNLYNPGERCATKTTSEIILDLDRMGLINKCPQTPVQGVQLYPTSSKILPPTPTFNNQGYNTHLESKIMEDKSRHNSSSKEPSPRSEDDDDDVVNDKEVKMAFSGTLELLKSRSMYKDEFVLEESRPRDLSLRSSSSEESHRSKASDTSNSSGDVFIKEIQKPGTKSVGTGKQTQEVKKDSVNPVQKQDNKKGGKNNNRPSAVVMACVPFQNQILNNICAVSKVADEKMGKTVLSNANRSANSNKNKITVHSQLLDDNSTDSKNNNYDSKNKGSAKTTKSASSVPSSAKNSAGQSKAPMQVVSSKLLSNVKEEIKKTSKLLEDDKNDECVKKEVQEEKSEKEREKLEEARKKLTKSESNMSDIKQHENRAADTVRPKTQASANMAKNSGSASNKNVTNRSGVIVASVNQNGRNNSSSAANQNNKNGTPSYLQPTRASNSRDISPSTARKTPLPTRNANSRNSSGIATNKTSQSISTTSVSNPPSANSKHTTFTSISTMSEKEEKQTQKPSAGSATVVAGSSAVTVCTVSTSAVNSSTGNKVTTSVTSSSNVTFVSSAKSSVSKNSVSVNTKVSSANSVGSVKSASKTSYANVTPTDVKSVRSTSNTTTVKDTQSTPSSGNVSRVNSSGTVSKPSLSGFKKSPTDSNVSQAGASSNATKTITTTSSTVTKSIATSGNSESTTTSKVVNSKESDTTAKTPRFPYKPASAGKPPLVEIVTSETPRVPKSKCIDSQVVIPVQTPLIVNPFENFDQYKDKPEVDAKQTTNKKGNQRGVSATSYGYVVSKPQMERSKTNVSVKSQGKNGKKNKDGKPSSASAKLGGRRKGAKSKESKGSDDGISRPKSGKRRVKSGKRRKKGAPEVALSKQAEQPDVALISGIGWHLATKCIDTSDVIAVKTRDMDSSSEESDDDLDENTPRPERMLTQEEIELLTSEDFTFPLNLDLDSPRLNEEPMEIKIEIPDNSLLVNRLNVNELASPNSLTPRFKQVKQSKEVEPLPKIEYDGYRPMNLDMTQSSLTADRSYENDRFRRTLPSDVNEVLPGLEIDDTDMFSNPELDEVTAELHKQILLGKLTPIPESPSLKSTLPIHKTVEALQNFDRNVQAETLDTLLGLNPGEVPDTSRTNKPEKFKPCGGSQVKEAPNVRKSGNGVKASSLVKEKESNAKGNKSGKQRRVSDPTDGHIDAKEAVRLSIENIRAAIAKSKKANAAKPDRKIKKSASDSKLLQSSGEFVPKLDFNEMVLPLENEEFTETNKGGHSTRRERKFSETKSEEKVENDNNLDEAIEDIMSNTFTSSSTLRSHKSSASRSNTLTDADRQLLMKMTANDSPFHAKSNLSASVSEVSPRKRHNSDTSYDDITGQHSTNPNLMKVFHPGDFKLGQKVKAMMDAGADKAKIKTMINVDNEAKQIAKIMNSFRNMELYAGPGGSFKGSSKRPDYSHGEPSSSKKPPFVRPGSGGPIGKARSAGKFTEIRGSRTEENTSARNSGQKDGMSRNFQHQTSQNNSGFPGGDIDDELVNALNANSPENTTIVSQIMDQYDSMSRSASACTSISSQSNLEDTIQWKKGNVLGKGAFGTVWCGLTSEGQLIAVKQIELNTNDKDKAKREYEKVQEEVELLKTLNHKNIVGYLGTNLEEEDSVVSIFMQFVPGGSIASILARFGALDEAVFRRYTRQILEGVEYLHANDVIHRDIKGGNVMLMPNGIIKLIDFGCAKRLCINLSMGQSQILKSMKGTPYWMAPEVVNETGHGKKSDIWSIGCTIFEMATRKPPWSDMNPMAAIFAIGSDREVPKLSEKFSPEAVEFVGCCLTRDQNKRLSATQLLQHNFILKRKNSKR